MSLGFTIGVVVCVHGFEDDGDTWVGTIVGVMPAMDETGETFMVRPLGTPETTFPCAAGELRETVMTFTGARCPFCR